MRSVFAVVILMYAWNGGQDPTGSVDDGLAPVRTALGGEVALEAARAIRMEGRSTRVIGLLKIASHVTLTLVRPDRYLRVDTLSLTGRTAEMAIGFTGSTVVQRARSQDGTRIDPVELIPAAARGQALRAAAEQQRRELRLLLLGCFAGPFDSSPMTASSRGIADAPDGNADVRHLAFADGSDALLFTDRVTQLPLMVSWQGPDVLTPIRASLGTSPPPAADAGRSAATPGVDPKLVEHRLYFSDYRPADVLLRWPFVIRRTVGGELVEELRFDRIAINPHVDARIFDSER